MRRSCGRAVRRRKSIKRDRGTDGPTDARRGSTAGRRTCDQEVASSISGLRNDSGQVVHTQLPRRRQSSSAYRVVKRGTFIRRTDGRVAVFTSWKNETRQRDDNDSETFRLRPSTSKWTIRIADEGWGGGVGGAYVCDSATV